MTFGTMTKFTTTPAAQYLLPLREICEFAPGAIIKEVKNMWKLCYYSQYN